MASASKRFGAIEALDHLSLALAEREWVGLLGPNGAGKSTLMGAIAGVLELDAGRIEVFGQWAGVPATPRALPRADVGQVGFVPQAIALYPLLTTAENLSAFGRLHGIAKGDLRDRVAWALDWTGLERQADIPTVRLSGGMQRRLNIACGVLHRPRLVLLDEPTVGVDPQGRQRIWRMLEELRTGGASLLHSTHELHEIEAMCDRMLIMDHGRILAQGTVAELVEKHLGARAELRLTLDRPAAGIPPTKGLEIVDNRLRGILTDVATELPAILTQVRAAGLGIHDVHVAHPNLAAVFTHLTGRELRE